MGELVRYQPVARRHDDLNRQMKSAVGLNGSRSIFHSAGDKSLDGGLIVFLPRIFHANSLRKECDDIFGVAEAERTARKGAKGFFLPYYPARPYYDPYYDTFWSFCSESGIVASLHHMFGGKRPSDRPKIPGVDSDNLRASATVKSYFSSIDHLTDMILTGVFQRFPKLKFMHAEVNVGWAGYRMQQMYLTVNRPKMKGANWYPNMPTEHPEEHIGTNVFFTALDDYLGFKLARENACLANATMYSTDYQHSITLWPDSQTFIPKLTDGMDEDLKYKLLAGNAVHVFNLE